MPITEPLTGDEFQVYAAADTAGNAPPPDTAFVVVDGLNTFNRGSERPTTSSSFFGRPQQVTTFGKRNVTLSVGGSPVPDDPGQVILRAAESGPPGTTCWIRVQYATGAYYTQEVRVGSRRHNVDSPDGLQGMTFDFAAVGEPIVVSGARVL